MGIVGVHKSGKFRAQISKWTLFLLFFALFSLEIPIFQQSGSTNMDNRVKWIRILHFSSFSVNYLATEMYFWQKISWNRKFQAFFTNFDLSSTAWFNCEPSNGRKGPDVLSLSCPISLNIKIECIQIINSRLKLTRWRSEAQNFIKNLKTMNLRKGWSETHVFFCKITNTVW